MSWYIHRLKLHLKFWFLKFWAGKDFAHECIYFLNQKNVTHEEWDAGIRWTKMDE